MKYGLYKRRQPRLYHWSVRHKDGTTISYLLSFDQPVTDQVTVGNVITHEATQLDNEFSLMLGVATPKVAA